MPRILIVEDDADLSQLFQRVLKKNGYEVKGVENGQYAMDEIHRENYDLILSDIMMPVMDGYELVRTLRKEGISIPMGDDYRQGCL